ncbi:MAG: hypothetical protein V9F04_15860 [Dermatophilaceae bacterium]
MTGVRGAAYGAAMTYAVNTPAVRAAWSAHGDRARAALRDAMATPAKGGDSAALGGLTPYLRTATSRMDAMALISAQVLDELHGNLIDCMVAFERTDQQSEMMFRELA